MRKEIGGNINNGNTFGWQITLIRVNAVCHIQFQYFNKHTCGGLCTLIHYYNYEFCKPQGDPWLSLTRTRARPSRFCHDHMPLLYSNHVYDFVE